MQHRWVTVLLAACAACPAMAIEQVRQVSDGPPPPELQWTFADLGAGSIALHGVLASAAINFGIREDQLVAAATLRLRLTYSPALLQDLSHLRVSINGQTVSAIPLARSDAGHEVERVVTLDSRYFSDYNQVQLDLIGHYSEGCEDPDHSSIWVRINGQSTLALSLRALGRGRCFLVRDAGRLPQRPFSRDFRLAA